MVRTSVLAVVLSAFVSTSCGKGKPPPQQMPENNVSEAPPTDPPKGDPGHTTKNTKGFAPDITLPKGTGAPPVATTAAIPADKLHALGALEFAGFRRSIYADDSTAMEVRYETSSRPHLRVTVRIEPCGPSAACTKMDLEQWRAKGDALKSFLTPKLLANKDTKFDVEAITLNNTTLIGTYQVGLDVKTDENNNPLGDASDAYVSYYNDGKNRIQVMAEYRDDLPKSIGQMQGYASRELLQMMSTRFLDYFTQNWGS